jgi:hypothetical protein
MNCPECGAQCERDEVDVGVGWILGPWGCFSCGWSEWSEYSHRNQLPGIQGYHLDPMGGLTPSEP